MNDPTSAKRQRVRELCRKLKPILGNKMDQLYMAFTAEDAVGKDQILFYLEALADKHLTTSLDAQEVDLVPPPASTAAGSYELGTVQYGGKPQYPFGLRESEWIQHAGVFGRSGAGKTNLGFEIFRQLRRHGKPVLVFDWKRNYRDLLTLPGFEDIEVYTVGRNVAPFRFNPLIPPPGTDPKTWLKQLIEVVAHSYMLGNGVLYLLQETLHAVYTEHGVYDSTVTQWPTFREVLERARERNARGRESAWLSSTLRALSSLNFGEMEKLLNTAQDQRRTLEHLLTKPVILEMDALGQSDKIFIISALLLYIHHLRMAEGQRETFKNAIIIEEAHHVLSNERRSLLGGQSVMEITFREIREYGTAVVALDQHPSKISLAALGNTYCTICLNLKHQKDVSAMAQSMLLEGAEKDLLGSLEVGQAVVKLQGRVPRPFLITVPEFPIRKGTITDDMIQMRMAYLNDAMRYDVEPVQPQPVIPNAGTDPESETLSREIAFLRDVLTHPESGVAARYKRLEMSVRQGQKLKGRLTKQSFIEEHEDRTSTGRIRIIRLTEKGREFLEKHGIQNIDPGMGSGDEMEPQAA